MMPILRVWSKLAGDMYKVVSLDWRCGVVTVNNGCAIWDMDFKDVIIMQSTGLKDDFGNELFEGDIFESRFSGIKYVVYWDDELASFWIKGETKTHPLYTLTPFHPRILGNIYENPELLEDN